MAEDQHEHLAKFMFQQRMRLFGRNGVEMELEAKKDLNERTFLRAGQGKLGAQKRADLICRVFEQYVQTAEFTAFAVTTKRPSVARGYPPLYLPPEYVFLLERISCLADDMKTHQATLVFDNMILSPNNSDLSRRLSHFLFAVDRGKRIAHSILDVALFVGSHLTPGVQVADLIGGVVRQYYDRDLDDPTKPCFNPYDLRLKQFYCIAKSRSRDYFSEERQHDDYGFYLMRDREEAIEEPQSSPSIDQC
jgi:hypothetical protein